MASKKPRRKSILNRRASFDYNLLDTFVVGMSLTGAETKALRLGHGQLSGAYVTIKDHQLLLINATVNGTNGIHIDEQNQTRARILLAKKREIDKLIQAKQQGNTIIPIEILNQGRFIKLKIALATGKKHYDKRQAMKARDEQKQINRVVKSQH